MSAGRAAGEAGVDELGPEIGVGTDVRSGSPFRSNRQLIDMLSFLGGNNCVSRTCRHSLDLLAIRHDQ